MDPFAFYSAASTGIGVLADIFGANAADQAGKANAQVAEINARSARQMGASNESRVRRESAQILGAQKVGFAKAGVQMTGTALDVAAESARAAELDALMARYAGRSESAAYLTQANVARSSGSSAWSAVPVAAGNRILSGLNSWQSHQDQLDLLQRSGIT